MLEVKWKEQTCSRSRTGAKVSILVMLEVKWKDLEVTHQTADDLRFNPCYVGSKIERKELNQGNTLQYGFNPCYVGSKIESCKRQVVFY